MDFLHCAKVGLLCVITMKNTLDHVCLFTVYLTFLQPWEVLVAIFSISVGGFQTILFSHAASQHMQRHYCCYQPADAERNQRSRKFPKILSFSTRTAQLSETRMTRIHMGTSNKIQDRLAHHQAIQWSLPRLRILLNN